VKFSPLIILHQNFLLLTMETLQLFPQH